MSPTQRSLKLLRSKGYTVQVVEHWNRFARRRIDLFSFADLIAFDPAGHSVTLIQTTAGDGHPSSRITKIKACPIAHEWLRSPVRRLFVHGWRLTGERGKQKRYQCREIELGIQGGEIVVMSETPAATPTDHHDKELLQFNQQPEIQKEQRT